MERSFTDDQKEALEACETNQLVFISGPGGTGKSFLIHYLKEKYQATGKSVHLLSSTGISAYHIGGMTVHSFLARIKMTESEFFLPLTDDDIIIIDEISMLGKKIFDQFEETLRLVRSMNLPDPEPRPFGGMKILFFGDFAQLPPVNDEYCFESVHWSYIERTIDLTEIKRQTDREFSEFLLRIRSGKLGLADRKSVESFQKHATTPRAIHLFASNEESQEYNEKRLTELCSVSRQSETTFPAIVQSETFSEQEIESFFSQRHQFYQHLKLAIGARVMLTKNISVEEGWCNGTVGTIQSISQDSFIVRRDGEPIQNQPMELEIQRIEYTRIKCGQECQFVANGSICGRSKCTLHPYDPACNVIMAYGPRKGKICGSLRCKRHPQSEVVYMDTDSPDLSKRIKQFLTVRQFPIVLSWGITIHKSQGMTLAECAIHLPKYKYCPSLIYVALSRCKTKEGVSIESESPIKYDAICPDEAIMSRVFKYRLKSCSICHEEFIGPYPFCRDCSCSPGKYSLYCFKAFVQNMTPDRVRYAEFAMDHPTYSSAIRWKKFIAYLHTIFEVVE